MSVKFFDCWLSSTCCTATRPSMDPARYPLLSGNAATVRVWYLSGDWKLLERLVRVVEVVHLDVSLRGARATRRGCEHESA